MASQGILWVTGVSRAEVLFVGIESESIRAVFNLVSKVITALHWFCITSLSDWCKVLAPFCQPIISETKTNRGLRKHIFPRFVSASCIYFEF